jgi:hypothetical protein
MTISKELADEIRAIFAPPPDTLPDRDEYAADIATLNSLADFMLEVGLPQSGHLMYACGDTVYEQTVASLSPAVRRAIFGSWE